MLTGECGPHSMFMVMFMGDIEFALQASARAGVSGSFKAETPYQAYQPSLLVLIICFVEM